MVLVENFAVILGKFWKNCNENLGQLLGNYTNQLTFRENIEKSLRKMSGILKDTLGDFGEAVQEVIFKKIQKMRVNSEGIQKIYDKISGKFLYLVQQYFLSEKRTTLQYNENFEVWACGNTAESRFRVPPPHLPSFMAMDSYDTVFPLVRIFGLSY